MSVERDDPMPPRIVMTGGGMQMLQEMDMNRDTEPAMSAVPSRRSLALGVLAALLMIREIDNQTSSTGGVGLAITPVASAE